MYNSPKHWGALDRYTGLWVGLGWGGGCEQMCTLHAVVVLCFCGWQVLVNRSMRIQDLYVGTFPRFIRNISIYCWGGDVYREGEIVSP